MYKKLDAEVTLLNFFILLSSFTLETNPFLKAIEKSILFAYLVSYIYGVATSLTPCVYPMIAITVALFGAKKSNSKRETIVLSLLFVFGIASMYTILGIISAAGGVVFGSLLSNRYLIGAIAVIFIILALNMFGVYEITLPEKLQIKLNKISTGKKGYISAFITGFLSGIIAAPCTTGITLGMMIWISTTQNILFGATFFFVYAIGLSTLFFLVGVFSLSLPKSGRWLEGIKTTIGVTMIGVSFYYINTIYPIYKLLRDKYFFYIAGIFLIIISIPIGALHLTYHTTSFKEKLRKTIGIIIINIGTILVLEGVLITSPSKLHWETDIENSLKRGRLEQKPILIDFTARWCGACMKLEKVTFTDPEVINRLKRFIIVKIDSTEMNKEVEKVHSRFNIRGLPTIIILDSKGGEFKRITDFIKPSTLIKYLDEVH